MKIRYIESAKKQGFTLFKGLAAREASGYKFICQIKKFRQPAKVTQRMYGISK